MTSPLMIPLLSRFGLATLTVVVCALAAVASPALAEESPGDSPVAESPPEPAPSYVPPPEAHEGVGGWAVVDPATGNVHGVIVGTIDTFRSTEAQGGMGHSYMGCHANCVLRFQTRATSDGNVAGWHGTQTLIDSNGQATQSNDGSVKWNEKNRTFSLNNQISGGQQTQTIVPERTSRSADGTGRSMDLHTGIVDIETTVTREVEGQSAQARVFQRDLQSTTSDVTLMFPLWSPDQRAFRWVLGNGWFDDSEASRGSLNQITSDVDRALVLDGYTASRVSVDEETGEETTTTVLDTDNRFVVAIQSVTRSVVDFFQDLFGLLQETRAVGD